MAARAPARIAISYSVRGPRAAMASSCREGGSKRCYGCNKIVLQVGLCNRSTLNQPTCIIPATTSTSPSCGQAVRGGAAREDTWRARWGGQGPGGGNPWSHGMAKVRYLN